MKYRNLLHIGILAFSLSACMTGKVANSVTTTRISQGAPQPQNTILYALPKTVFNVVVEMEKTTVKAGPFKNYTYRYLNIDNAPQQDTTIYKLKAIKVTSQGMADPTKQFAINAKGDAAAQFINLSADGVLIGINDTQKTGTSQPLEYKPLETPNLSFDSIPLLEKHLKATSEAMMAEAVANHIYKLRKRQLKLAGYEYEHHPNDAATLKLTLDQLKKEEIEFTQLFIGKQTSQTITKNYTITPTRESEIEVELFRFSDTYGLLNAQEAKGEPIYFSYSPIKDNSLKPTTDFVDESTIGIYYCNPSEVELKLLDISETLFQGRFKVAQLGTLRSLPNTLLAQPFTIIKLDPATGSLVEISKSK